jgi:Rps23 Pro-64 3,4-dihydroxylase Tpa1-like proline 4-hydroxylase
VTRHDGDASSIPREPNDARGTIAVDREWLSSWVDDRHLTRDLAIAEAADRPIVIHEFLRQPIAERARAFLRDDVECRIVSDKLYQFHVIAGLRPEARLGSNLVTYLKLRKALSDARFAAFIEQQIGIELGPGDFDAHLMLGGDFLAPHTDAIDGRSFAAVLFLSPEWPPSFGGALRIEADRGECWTIEPRFNTFVAFDVTTGRTHAVDRVEAPVTAARLSISGWFQRPR